MSKNLLARIAVAALAIPIILYICYHGGMLLFGMVSLFAVSASIEFLIREGYGPRNIAFWWGLAIIALFLSIAQGNIHTIGEPQFIGDNLPFTIWLAPFVVLVLLLTGMATALGKKDPVSLFNAYVRFMWGVLYIGLLYPFVYAIGSDIILTFKVKPAVNGDLLLFLFGLLWIGDTCAMGFGKWIGKHKLAPGVSPNKTVEGFIGGIIGAVAIGVLMYFWKFHQMPFVHIMVISVGCSIFGQLGDLVESMWKRSLGIKDSSNIIPGHGGVLDRFDSLLFAAPFMYGYLMLLN